ncbi:MAG TPA: MobF family relaxase [Saprospiraceae bacterium]|nr:MobF family relaxase [Saprospiraceae bacterium]
MLRIIPSKSAAGAAQYFRESLSVQDYISEKQNVAGLWLGKGAEILGLKGEVNKEDFELLLHNRKHGSDEKLTPRDSHKRRAGYDFTFNALKSVSIVYAITGDQEILKAHRESVEMAMKEIERHMQTQSGQGKDKKYITTGNLIAASFEHNTARPVETIVDGKMELVPDMHLHSHVYILNGTYFEKQNRFQAIELGTVVKEANYYESLYHSYMAAKLLEAGYRIEKSGKRYEIAGISRSLIEKYSSRTKEIEAIAHEKNKQRELHGKKPLSAEYKSQIGAKSRHRKNGNLKPSKLQMIWQDRLSDEEWNAIMSAKDGTSKTGERSSSFLTSIDVKKAIDLSIAHHLERRSAISEKRVLAKAIEFGYGKFSVEDAQKELASRENIIGAKFNDNKIITTKEMLSSEDLLIRQAVRGKGNCKSLSSGHKVQNHRLNKDQKEAVSQILHSNDKIMIVSGVAGVGKTTLFQEVSHALNLKGLNIIACAPSAEAVKTLQEKGFKDAQTIAALLKDKNASSRLQNQTLLVDEAGMVSVQLMNSLIALSKDKESRIILSGDTRQHSSVEAGDALRILEQRSGIKVIKVDEIMRQKSNEDYRKAIVYLSKGETLQGFDKLDELGAIKELDDREMRNSELAGAYVSSMKENRTALLITPTHAEGKEATLSIREKLKDHGMIGLKDKQFNILQDLSLTKAEKSHITSYAPGMIVQFHNNVKGFKLGEQYEIKAKEDHSVFIGRVGKEQMIPLPFDQSSNFQVYKKETIDLAKNDLIRITKNSTSIEGTRLYNGQVLNIKSFDQQGNMALSNGSKLANDHGNFAVGYYSTSMGSQGKTAQDVFISQSAISHPASSDKQFYVSASRGSERIFIYTDNKEELRDAVLQSDNRLSAKEVSQMQEKEHMKLLHEKMVVSMYQKNLNKHLENEERHLQRGFDGQPIKQMEQPQRGDHAG